MALKLTRNDIESLISSIGFNPSVGNSEIWQKKPSESIHHRNRFQLGNKC